MVAGHFGFAAVVKSGVPTAPLWVLMLATQWLDVFFVPLYLAGIETIVPLDPGNAGNLPLLGFGLWGYPVVAALLELALVLGGAYFYHRRAMAVPVSAALSAAHQRRRVLTASGVVTGLMLLSLIGPIIGI